jgi:preprotein translocase subunit SecE
MDRKWTYVMFAVGALILGYLFTKVGDWAWTFYANKPNDLLVSGASFGLAAVAALIALRNERLFTLASEVTTELKKVTWPTRKETFAATIVVIVTVIVSAAFLGIFDNIWRVVTEAVFTGTTGTTK